MLEIQDHNASSDVVPVENGATISYTAQILVNQLITSAVVLATYNDGVTRRSDQIKPIGIVCMI